MFKSFKLHLAGAAALVLSALGFVPEAQAYSNNYCREYTRTVYIGNRAQEAYGQACLQPNGDWMIVGEGLGNDIPNNVSNVQYIIRDNTRYITPNRVVYYERPGVRYVSKPAPFVWYNGGHYKGGHHVKYNHVKHKPPHHNNKHWDRHDHRRDRHDNRGRGNNRDHHRNR